MFVYFGTYTGEKSQGIYRARLDLAAGTVSEPELAATVTSPSFLALDPARRHLYAANEMGKFGDKPTGAVSAFAIDRATGALTLLNQESSGGSGPAHVSVDRAGRTVLVANYGGGSVASLPIGAGRAARAGGVGDRAPGLERAPEAPDQAVRALDQHGHGEHLRLCRRPRRRSHLHLPSRSEVVDADARDAGLRGADARIRPASPLVPPGLAATRT